MATTRTTPIIRLLPSLTDLAFLMPIVFLFARMEGAKSMLGDGDTGWHIRTGEWILANGRVPSQDMFSFTKAGEPWFAWEWLWDLSFAWLYQHGGLAAVVAASIFVISLTFALLFRLILRRCDNPLIAAAFTFLACVGSSLHWLARPHLFTMLFVVIWVSLLERVQAGRRKLLFALPLLMVLWTNLHGGFFVGLVILGAYAAGEIVKAAFTADPTERRSAIRSATRLTVTGVVCAAATLLNPYTYHLHAHILQFFREPYHFQYIVEYQSVNFHTPAARYFEVILFLAPLSAIWLLIKRNEYIPLVLVAGWAHLALFSARNVPLFALLAAPYMAQALDGVLSGLEGAPVAAWVRRSVAAFKRAADDFAVLDRAWRVHVVSLAGAILILALLTDPNAKGKLKSEFDPKRYPAKALDVLRARPDSRIFADDEWGDYLVYQLYPGQKVFIDGRDDFYGQDFEQKYVDLLNVKFDWEQYLRKHRIDTVLLSTTSALAGAIKESRNWRVIYDDTVAVVFLAVPQTTPVSQELSTAQRGGISRDQGTASDRRSRITRKQQEGA